MGAGRGVWGMGRVGVGKTQTKLHRLPFIVGFSTVKGFWCSSVQNGVGEGCVTIPDLVN